MTGGSGIAICALREDALGLTEGSGMDICAVGGESFCMTGGSGIAICALREEFLALTEEGSGMDMGAA